MTDSTVSAPIEAPSQAAAPLGGTSRLGWYTVCMATMVAVMSQIDRGILSLFIQPMKRDFHLSDTQVSVLIGFAFTFFYVVGGPPLSRMADRGVRKNVIAGCLAVWSCATALCGFAQNYWVFFGARAVIGSTEAGCGPASLSLISDTVPLKRMPRAYALYNSGFIGGQALSLLIGGVLFGLLAHVQPIQLPGIGVIRNWQLVFVMLGIPGLIIAAVVRFTVPEPGRRGARKPGGYPIKDVIGYLVTQRALHLPLMIGVLLMNFQIYGIITWMPAFYERTYGWGPAKIGPLLGAVTLVCSVMGLFAGARLAEWLGKRHDDANIRTLFLAQFLAVPMFVIQPLMPTPWLALGCGGVASFLYVLGGPGYNAAINIAAPNEMRAQVNVMYFIIANAIAGSLGPTIVALITDHVARSEADLRYVIFGLRLILGPLTALCLWKAVAPYGRIFRERTAAGG